MKAHLRISLSLCLLTLIIITVGCQLAQPSVSSAEVHTYFASAPVATVSPSPMTTQTPTLASQIDDVVNPIQSITNLFAVLLIIVLVGFIIIRIGILARSSNVIIETFKNSTGNADLDKVLLGLTQLTREMLVEEINDIRAIIEKKEGIEEGDYRGVISDQRYSKHLTSLDEPLSRLLPISQDEWNNRLTSILTSLQDTATGEVKTAVQLLSIVFPLRGTKIITVLQHLGQANVQLGISLEVTDLRDYQVPTLKTLWEPSNSPTEVQSASLEERYTRLLKPAARWLAIELTRRAMMTKSDFFYTRIRKHTRYLSQVYNYIGLLFQITAQDELFSDYPLFFDLAIQSFQKANTLDGIWFEPYWNIGLTYTMKTENVQDNNNINLLKKAVQDLNRALKCLDLDRQSQFTLSPPVKKAVPNILTSLIFDKKATERENIERWIKVLKAFVQVRIGIQTNDNKLIDQAKLVIDGIENSPNGWSDTSELDSGLLYNLACYHAILEECPGHCDEKLIGRRYLTYSLARKPKLVKSAKGDPALKNIIDGLDNLYDILIQELQVQDSKLKLTGDPFKVAISKVLIEANWSS